MSKRLSDIERVDELIEEALNSLHNPQAIVYTAQNAEAAFEEIKTALVKCAAIIDKQGAAEQSADTKAKAYDKLVKALEGVLPE